MTAAAAAATATVAKSESVLVSDSDGSDSDCQSIVRPTKRRAAGEQQTPVARALFDAQEFSELQRQVSEAKAQVASFARAMTEKEELGLSALAALRSELDAAKKSNAQLAIDFDNRIAACKEETARADQISAVYQHQKEELARQNAQLKSDIAALDSECDAGIGARNQAEADVLALEKKLADESAAAAALRLELSAKKVELTRRDADCTTLTNRYDELGRRYESEKKATREHNASIDARHRTQLEAAMEAAARSAQFAKEEKLALESKMRSLSAEHASTIAALRASLSEAKREAEAAHALQTRVVEEYKLKSQNEQAEAKSMISRVQSVASKSTAAAVRLKEEKAALEQKSIRDSADAASTITVLRGELEVATTASNRLTIERGLAVSRVSALKQQLDEQRGVSSKRVFDLEAQLAIEKLSTARVVRERDAAYDSAKRRSTELDSVCVELAAQNKLVRELQNEATVAAARHAQIVAELEGRITEHGKDAARLNDARIADSKRLEEMKSSLADSMQKLTGLAAAKTRISELQAEVTAAHAAPQCRVCFAGAVAVCMVPCHHCFCLKCVETFRLSGQTKCLAGCTSTDSHRIYFP